MITAQCRVSVIVPTKNRSALLREALSSIRALEGPDLNLEIIVADNGSSDDTPRVARELGAAFVQTDVPGAAAARNAGLQAATGELIAFLDDDDIWLPEHLRPHIRLLATSPDVAAVVGQVINTDQTLTSRSTPWPRALPEHGSVFPSFLEYLPQIGATLVRASVRESVGYFDERLLGDQDWDWHLRLALRHRVAFVPMPCVLFRQRPSGERDELYWARSRFNRQVFWQNIWRAGHHRPPLHVIARLAIRHRGAFAGNFVRSAVAHAGAGDLAAAQRAFIWAIRSSPLHVAGAMLRDTETRRAAWLALGGPIDRRASAPGAV